MAQSKLSRLFELNIHNKIVDALDMDLISRDFILINQYRQIVSWNFEF